MRLVSYWRRAHKRNSVRALIVGTVTPLITAIWSALPGAFVDRLPLWLVLLISAGIAAMGLAGAYISQPSLQEKDDA
ncbi:hypothetical protein P0D69_15425 [Paraburkholderia sediminicola]|uniref:DUF7940 domain-containing protein n=1 Tax=Paraburkholderia sediminicola TaxID=458836 RepID=UPI0038BC7AFC